jgi:hypothetical protein
MTFSIAALDPALQLCTIWMEGPTVRGVCAVVGKNAADRFRERGEIDEVGAGFIEPPVAIRASAAVSAIWIVCSQDRVAGNIVDRSRRHWLKEPTRVLQPVDLQILIGLERRGGFGLDEETLPLRRRIFVAGPARRDDAPASMDHCKHLHYVESGDRAEMRDLLFDSIVCCCDDIAIGCRPADRQISTCIQPQWVFRPPREWLRSRSGRGVYWRIGTASLYLGAQKRRPEDEQGCDK